MEQTKINNILKTSTATTAAKVLKVLIITILISSINSHSFTKTSSTVSPIVTNGPKIYVYSYPLVKMEITKQIFCKRFPINTFYHATDFPDPSSHTVVMLNMDTLYSQAWLDLSISPVIITLPEFGSRYYVIQAMDAWTNTFSSIGTRTTGHKSQKWIYVGPDFKGNLPEEFKNKVIKSPTNMVWLLGRIQTNSKEDIENVKILQNGIKIELLNSIENSEVNKFEKLQKIQKVAIRFLEESEISSKPTEALAFKKTEIQTETDPNIIIDNMPLDQYMQIFTKSLIVNSPSTYDNKMIEKLNSVGIKVGEVWDGKISSLDRKIWEKSVILGKKLVEGFTTKIVENDPKKVIIDKWEYIISGIGKYDDDYIVRARIANVGIGANLPEDAIYARRLEGPEEGKGKEMTSLTNYRIHFSPSNIPPVNAFWSITLYEQGGFLTENEINRYVIRDRDNIKFNSDGSFDLYLRRTNPGIEKESNWLPTPKDQNLTFSLTIRCYWPGEEILKGKWVPPSLAIEN